MIKSPNTDAGRALYLIAQAFAAMGYFPLPLAADTKQPFQKDWNIWPDWRTGDYDRAGLVGLRQGDGGVFTVDVDFDNAAIEAALRWEFLGAPTRIGARGFAAMLRWANGKGRAGHDLR